MMGVSIPQYSEEELEKFRTDNEKGITYNGKHYTLYEATQRQRNLEASIRKQRRRILIDEATGDTQKLQADQIKAQVLKREYNRFSKAAGLRQQHDRMETVGYNWKQEKAAEKAFAKYEKVRYNSDGTVAVTDDWTSKNHPSIPAQYIQNAVIDTVSQNGRQRDRTFYDADGRQVKQISNGGHGNRTRHPFGSNGEHAHDVAWKDGEIIARPIRELTDDEKKKCGDIL